MPNEAASEAILGLLESKVDASTYLDFSVGPDGFLKQPSSLRVFLLDHLARVDKAAAADYAEKVLGSFGSAEEWAISLRNYAQGKADQPVRTFLQDKFREMLDHHPWSDNPSTGFLESFDVAVYTGGTELLPDLTKLVRRKDNQALAHAAYLALDRLTLEEPTAILKTLQDKPALMEGREVTRANYFARARVEDQRQRDTLEKYLLDPARGDEELNTFAGLYPNANFMISHNLLTRNTTPTGDAVLEQDRAALRAVHEWITDPRFERLKPRLEKIRSRLEGFVGKAAPANG